MPKFVAGILITLAVLAVATQLALPAYVEGQVKDRLEEGGGSADVSVGAFPAVTLIAGRGKELTATGEDLVIDLDDRRDDPFGRLDGFEDVDVELTDVDAGALRLSEFELRREGRDAEYDMRAEGTTTPAELASELGTTAGGPLGGLLGGLAGDLLPGAGDTEVPLELTATVDSQDGRPEVTDATGSVAGLPAGPLTEVVLGAVLDRL